LLLDALYGQEDRFQDWLTRHPGNAAPRLTLVTKDTMGRTSTFLAGIKAAKRRDSLPESYRDLTAGEKSAAVLEIHPDLGHMEIIVGGKALPILLRRSPLKPLKTPVAPASPEVKKPDPVPPT
jgi:hypothetical protein